MKPYSSGLLTMSSMIEVSEIEDLSTSDGSSVRFHRHYSASTTTEVWLYEVIGGGHDSLAFGNQDIDSSRLCDFFGCIWTDSL